MKPSWKFLAYPLISLTAVWLDLWSKFSILAVFGMDAWGTYAEQAKTMPLPGFEVIGNFLRFTFVWNQGFSFGTMNSASAVPSWQPWVLIGLNFAIMAVVIFLFFRLHRLIRGQVPLLVSRLASAFIVGGAIGNNVDRFIHKAVVDFIDVGIGLSNSSRFFVFNVADSFVVVGAIGLGLMMLLFEKKPETKTVAE